MRLLRRQHSRRSARQLVSLLAAAVLVAGCGGGGGGGGKSDAYKAGAEICAPGVQEIATQYATAAEPKAVADAVAEAVSGGAPKDFDDAKQGCLDALAAAEK